MGLRKNKRRVNVNSVRMLFTPMTYLLMTAITAIVMILSWHGLTRFGKDVLGLNGWMVHIVPGALDGVVLMFAGIAVVSSSEGENASVARMMVNGYAVVSAVFNGYQGALEAPKKYETVSAAFYAGLSLTVAISFHWFLRRIQRVVRVDDGTLNDEVVHFPVREWMRFPIRRWKARTIALEYGIRDPKLAVSLEASKNDRIDSRVMLALEAYREDAGSRIYEFFPKEDVSQNGFRNRRKSTEKKPEYESASIPVEKTPERVELTTGTATGIAGTATGITHEVDSAIPAGTVRPERPEPQPEIPEIPGQTRCGGFDGPCDCRHRSAVTFFRKHAEAVEYARNETGNESGSDLARWLTNHGRKVGISTAYDAIRNSTGKGQVVPFRYPETSES